MIAVWWPDLIHLPFTLALLSAWPFMFLVVSQCLRPVWLITNRFFTHMGDLSFSLYLLHPPLVYFAEPIYGWLYDKAGGPGAGYVLSVLLTLVLLYPLARIAYRMIERPGIAWGERMIERRQQARRRLDAGCAPMPAE
jgi:peptidoglycan/LPS O-acetylase OafA/YrhL